MSPMNRAAFLSAFGAEQVAKAEQEARARVAEYRAAVDRSTYHRNEVAADDFELSGEAPAVGSFVWGRWSCMKGEGGPMGELEDLERMDQEGRENPRRLCEVVAVVDASPAEFLAQDFADGVARQFQDMGGSRYDENDPARLDGVPYTWEAVFCVRCADRWYFIDGQGYDYTRYLLFPCDFRAMYREELAGITAAREAQEQAAKEAARMEAERRRAEYLERCAKWAPYMTDATEAQAAYDATPWRDRKAHAASLRKLGSIRRGNISAMIRAAFPSLKFSVKKWDGWGGAYEVTYIDGPTEAEFTAALDLDLFAAIVDTFDGMTDCEGVERMEFTDFARQYMGDMYGGVRVSREMSDEARAELLDTLAGIAPAVCDVVGGRSVFLTMAEMSQFAAAVGLSLSAFNHYAHGEGYQDHPGVFVRRAWVERSYMTDATEAQAAYDATPWRDRKAHAAALRKLGSIRRGNISAMIRAAFPSLKFSVKKWDGWGGAYEVTYIDGPTEAEFTAALDLDLFEAVVDTFDGMTDYAGHEYREFTDFAHKYMGDMSGGVNVSREMSDETRAALIDTLAGIAPAVRDVVGGRSVFLTMAEMSQFAKVTGLSLSDFSHYARGEGYQEHPGTFARRAFLKTSYMTAAPVPSPTTPTGTDGQGAKGETSEGTPSEGSTGAAYGICEKSPISEKPAAGLQLVDIAGGGVAVTGDSRATYKARKEIKSHGATWNKAAKQWEAHDPAAVASLRAWFGLPVQDATPEASAPVDELPAPPALVSYDPAEPVERAEFHTSDEVSPTAPTDGSHPATEETPTEAPAPTDGATGAAYGDSQKSQIFMNPGEVYKTAKADRYIIILSDDGEKLRTTDAIRGRFSGNIDTSDKDRFLSCLEAGSIIKADASQLPPVTDVHTWREGLENGYGKAFEIRTELIYTAADAMTETEKADTAARMGFALPLDPLAVMDAAALHKWNASRGNYRHCAALEWLVTQQDEPTAFQMNAGAYPVIFADYARRI